MKILVLSLCLSIAMIACNSTADQDGENVNDTIAVSDIGNDQVIESIIARTTDENMSVPFYIISVEGIADENEAASHADELLETYDKVGYLWIPDYESLSGKELFAVFLGPYDTEKDCIAALEEYKKTNKAAYGVLVNHEKTRKELHGCYDIRIDGKKQNLVLIYSTPEDEDAYAEEGGEDWGWFVNDVSGYFSNNQKNIEFGSVYYGWLTESQITALENEIHPEGFGYIGIKGNEKIFISHDTPDSVIGSLCDFFGYECNYN